MRQAGQKRNVRALRRTAFRFLAVSAQVLPFVIRAAHDFEAGKGIYSTMEK
ncbi:hypothetical protein P9314_25715 [Paenibacillus validus]|uniref:Uncharacterized protein n=1 Tax=Paenibacillus validus TaxID=44253 RepID=A0A7X2Z6V1_9BACL|nr:MULTISPECIES: hypothetical protein [Paenibacillus]MED4604030.1 hypothetical protein [Paenibacillus validus]MED4609005.1 hypothetical protein [Paenibacillus validus]MUG69434.1 hypothetical protein [Paenibacillus validus]